MPLAPCSGASARAMRSRSLASDATAAFDVFHGGIPAEADAQGAGRELFVHAHRRQHMDGATLPDEQAEPELTITPSRSSAISAVSAAQPRHARNWMCCTAGPFHAEDDASGQRPVSARPRNDRADAAMRARSPSPSASAWAAAPKPAMPERFSVPARRPFCWPPPTSCGAKRRAFAHHQARPRPAGRRSCAPTASCNRRARNRARSCRPPAPHPPAAARRLRAPARETSRDGLHDAGLIVGRHHRDQRAALAFAQGHPQALRVSTTPSAVTGRSSSAQPGDAFGQPVGGCQHRTYARSRETNSRVMRDLFFGMRSPFHRAEQRQGIGFGGAAGENHLAGFAPASAATVSRASSTTARAARPAA